MNNHAHHKITIKRYDDLVHEVEAEADRINRRFQTSAWKPITIITQASQSSGVRGWNG